MAVSFDGSDKPVKRGDLCNLLASIAVTNPRQIITFIGAADADGLALFLGAQLEQFNS